MPVCSIVPPKHQEPYKIAHQLLSAPVLFGNWLCTTYLKSTYKIFLFCFPLSWSRHVSLNHSAGTIVSCSQSSFPVSLTSHFQSGFPFLCRLQGFAFCVGVSAFPFVCILRMVLAPVYGWYAQWKGLWRWMASCTEFGFRLFGITTSLECVVHWGWLSPFVPMNAITCRGNALLLGIAACIDAGYCLFVLAIVTWWATSLECIVHWGWLSPFVPMNAITCRWNAPWLGIAMCIKAYFQSQKYQTVPWGGFSRLLLICAILKRGTLTIRDQFRCIKGISIFLLRLDATHNGPLKEE